MLKALNASALLGVLTLCVASPSRADDPKASGKVLGLLMAKKDNTISVKADGETEAVDYVLPKGADKKLADAYKTVFNAGRVQLAYKKDGDKRQITGIARHIPAKAGTVTGEVVGVHDKFWVEVKPKKGLADGFAPGATNHNDKAFMEKLNGLNTGDMVTITYTTDFERHRIQSLKIDKRAESKDK